MRPIRVLAVLEAYTVGGPAKNLIEFGRRSAAPPSGLPPVELSIATFRRPGSPEDFVNAARDAGLTVHVIDEQGRFDTRAKAGLAAAVRAAAPDILQTHNVKSHLFVRLLALHRQYPWIVFNHGYTAADLKDRLYNQIDRCTISAADRVVAVCGPFANTLVHRGVDRNRIFIQHNSVKPFVPPPPEVVLTTRRRLQLAEMPVVLAVGRLSSEKGHADLLRAVAAMRDSGRRDWRTLFVGDGNQRANLERLTYELGVQDLVVLAGAQPDVAPYYALATALALPSHSEGSPNVVLEAMAAGVPVVAAAVGGVPEIVEDGVTGLLVPPRDPAAMARALGRLLDDGELRRRLSAAAGQLVSERHTPEAYCRSLIEMYTDVLAACGAKARPAAVTG